MTLETFDYIWEQGIVKAVESVISEISADDITEFKIQKDLSADIKMQVRNAYDDARQEIRQKYFNAGDNSENLIDGHKICACITKALLSVRLVRFDTSRNDIPIEVVYSNYAIAFLGGIYVLYLFVLSDYRRSGNSECYNALKEQATFYFPRTNQGHDDYAQGRIKTLALNDYYGNDFDILTYADMLFWIELYNRHLLELVAS